MWDLDCKESWVPKNRCVWTVVLEKTLESPLDCKEIKSANPKGYQSWIFIGSTDVVAECPIPWPPDVKSWLIKKDPDAGEGWSQEEKGMTEWDGWMASLTQKTWVRANSRSWWWTGSLVWCNPWVRKESVMTEWMNRLNFNTGLVEKISIALFPLLWNKNVISTSLKYDC